MIKMVAIRKLSCVFDGFGQFVPELVSQIWRDLVIILKNLADLRWDFGMIEDLAHPRPALFTNSS